MAFQYQKAKSAAKRIDVKNDAFKKLVRKTTSTIANIVGVTLGPGGMPVLLERPEFNLPAMPTKDGVTVMRSLGFPDPVQHAILEVYRDAAIRTASEAGDGTTTATILGHSIVEQLDEYCHANPKVSPQKVLRRLEEAFLDTIEPTIQRLSIPAKLETDAGYALLHSVAKVSANGDTKLADAVMECFKLVGDNGNVTIIESTGSSRYEVEKIGGFPIAMGMEACCMRFTPDFINDGGAQRCFLEKPCFVIYHGRVSSYNSMVAILQKIYVALQDPGEKEFKFANVVVVAAAFSDDAITGLATNFKDPLTINVFPLVAPMTAEPGSQLQFLQDLATITGATILEQNSIPLDQAQLIHLGRGVEAFEAHRWRSNLIVGEPLETDSEETVAFRVTREDRILNRSAEVEQQLREAPSDFTAALITERLAKLTGGIARLKVIGSSNGELKEKRDRAEDAVCGVRGAIKHGCLPGGCWALMKVIEQLEKLKDPIIDQTLMPALRAPFERLLTNSGILDEEERKAVEEPLQKSIRVPVMVKKAVKNEQTGEVVELEVPVFKPVVFDALESKHVEALPGGILDSTPAVLEAVRNALSIAGNMGTLGGAVVFPRDAELERYEARQTADYLREDATDFQNAADERG